MQPASYSIPDDIRATLVRLLAYMGALAALAVAAASFFAAPADIVAALGSASAQRPAWSTVERPYPAFELLMPELIGSTYTYAIQRRAKDGARKDLLSFGEPADAGPKPVPMSWSKSTGRPWPAIASSMRRARSQPALSITPSPTTSSRTARSTANSVRCRSWILPSRPTDHERRCLGFARPFNQPTMQIAGWYCSAGREVVDRATVACLLDRLTLVNGDAKLHEMFARAEVKRTFCGQRNPILAATPEREEQSAKLKSALRGRLSHVP